MKEDIKKQWVDALRSGEYAQGRARLRNNRDEFCCLGVLCDLAVKAGVIEGPIQSEDFEDYVYSGDILFPPHPVVKWAGLSSSNPTLVVEEDEYGDIQEYGAASLNDGGKTFEEIADLIEEKL